MKIRLINPCQLDEQGTPITFSKLFMPSLALPTIAGLTPPGVEVAITDDSIEAVDFDEEVDLVGLTALTCQAPRAYQIADAFRRRGVRTIMGGIHASLLPEEAARHVDAVVVGEAEDLWEEVLDDLRAGALKPHYQAAHRPDLQRRVIPRFDLLDSSRYVSMPLTGKQFLYLPVQTTRGCPYDCDMCAVVQHLGRRMRKKPIDNVLAEIRPDLSLLTFFSDDNFAGDPGYTRELLAAIRPLKIRWYCQLSTTIARDPELIEQMGQAGCLGAFLGIESLSSVNLRGLNKGFNRPEAYPALLSQLKEVGIMPSVSLIYGLEEDSYDSLMRALDLLERWNVTILFLFMLTPFPRTRLYERLAAQGRITCTDWSLFDAVHPVIAFGSASADEIVEAYWRSYERHYSLGNILRQTWRCRRPYLMNFPRNNVLQDLHYLLTVRKAVMQRRHPFTMGT